MTQPVRIGLIAAIGLLALPALSRAVAWQIDPAHTNVQFSARHLMISNVRGDFTKVSGTISAEGSDPASVKIDAVIDASSIDTRVAMRDQHLRSAEFFDVEKYPAITFKSKKVEPNGDGKWKLSGDLTLHGVTREVVLEVEGPTPLIKDPMGKTRVGASASATISRKDFGLTWNKTLDSGGIMIGDEIPIVIDIEAVQ